MSVGYQPPALLYFLSAQLQNQCESIKNALPVSIACTTVPAPMLPWRAFAGTLAINTTGTTKLKNSRARPLKIAAGYWASEKVSAVSDCRASTRTSQMAAVFTT